MSDFLWHLSGARWLLGRTGCGDGFSFYMGDSLCDGTGHGNALGDTSGHGGYAPGMGYGNGTGYGFGNGNGDGQGMYD